MTVYRLFLWTGNEQSARWNDAVCDSDQEARDLAQHMLAQSTHRLENGQVAERKVDMVVISSPGSAGNTADGCPVNTKESGNICGGAPCVEHGEHLGLLLGGELWLSAAAATLGAG
jgi:hypothetical protein